MKSLNEAAERATKEMFRVNSDMALQAIIELMLTDISTQEVIDSLRSWADYLDERK